MEKSTVAEEFGKQEYDSYNLIDFSKAGSIVKSYFFDYMTIWTRSSCCCPQAFNTRLLKRKSLIAFDEVQLFPKARECIKHLVADGRYDYLETGAFFQSEKT